MSEVIIIGLLIGVFAGILAGMFGIGGGVVIVPALILFLNFSITQANGTSLAALLLPVAILAVIQYYKAGYISIKISLYVAIGLFIGVSAGAKLALSVPGAWLKIAYGLFLLYVCWNFINPAELFRKFKNSEHHKEKSYSDENKSYNFYVFILVGILAGILSGMFGIGGGLVIVPFLIKFLNFNPKKAVGTSLGALLLPVGLPGVIIYYQMGNLNLESALPVAGGLVVGAFIGALITISLPVILVKRIYGVFLLIMSLNFFYQGFNNLLK